MNKKDLQKTLEDHLRWIHNEDGGLCANLVGADLAGVDLTGANLGSADLEDAYLVSTDLEYANLMGANLMGANLTDANLKDADLTDANLTGANLTDANLTKADLSGAKGLKTAKDYLSQFKRTKNGIYVYKTFGAYKLPPSHWKIEPNSFIEEVVNPDRCTDCGSGVNFATLEWIRSNERRTRDLPVWKCLIYWEDVADVVVPYMTDGKARCARLQLIKVVK